ncbi:hypothetical protein JW960_00225 [candidate division KSB1 bacterium]|nr:hypothetical protein [candidate division KSB1 bacterium]
MQDADSYETYKPNKKATWWMGAVERLEDEVGIQEAIEIMKACGRRCCSQGHRTTAKRLMAESSSVEEFLVKTSQYGVKEGAIEYKLKDERTIVGQFNRCFCGQVKRTTTPFKNRTYCHCSTEFHKHFFEAALGKDVHVEIIQSIISGATCCIFLIYLNDNE